MRVDLFSVIHKGLRSQLFELSLETARVDLTQTCAIDALVAKVEAVLGLLDEHAHHEDTHMFPILRRSEPTLANELEAEHRANEVLQIEVERAADALALADLSARPAKGAQLVRVVNHLIAMQLVHMNREETEVQAALWAAFDDRELAMLRTRVIESIPPARHAEWMKILAPALSPMERQHAIGASAG